MRTITTVILVFFCMGFYAEICAQEWEENKSNLIQNLTHLRSYILNNNSDFLEKLDGLLKKIDSADITQKEKDNIFQVLIIGVVHGGSYKNFEKDCKKHLKETSILKVINEEDYNIAEANFELLDLLDIGVLSHKYPYNIIVDETIIRELEYYDIKTNESIADIGAGSGSFSKLILLLGQSNDIYINELSKYAMEDVKSSMAQLGKYFPTERIRFVKGDKKNANLTTKVDKIIVRNTFHHFSKPKAMQESLYESLKDDGIVFINEPLKDISSSHCQKTIDVGGII